MSLNLPFLFTIALPIAIRLSLELKKSKGKEKKILFYPISSPLSSDGCRHLSSSLGIKGSSLSWKESDIWIKISLMSQFKHWLDYWESRKWGSSSTFIDIVQVLIESFGLLVQVHDFIVSGLLLDRLYLSEALLNLSQLILQQNFLP